ncbi:MAG: ABC transporter substrate-binding protein [Flavobacteriaceae bacterium]|nr:ABC transporter substrate-binding protein [Flavobacteriaceae bacterium]
MKINSFFALILCFSFIFLTSCDAEKSKKSEISKLKVKSQIRYAKGFDIQYFEKYKKLTIKHPYPDSEEVFEYIISNDINTTVKGIEKIQTPIQKVVVTSTTHIPILELLGVEDRLVGFQSTRYVSSEKTRRRIDSGFVKELGKKSALNTEVLFELDPDIVIGFAMTKTNKTYNFIEQNNIPVILNGDWLEETPLGRAEWIKFFGVLFEKEKEADSIFRVIESNYLAAKKIAMNSKKMPTILSGAIMSKGIWNLPAGGSYVAQYLKDANTDYLWKDSKGKGSLSLSFESVFDKGQKAEYWIAPGYFANKEQMLGSNKHYSDFTALQKNRIYTPSTKTGKTGGVIYFELAPIRPDLVLKDIIKITNPDLLPNYTLTFLELMK